MSITHASHEASSLHPEGGFLFATAKYCKAAVKRVQLARMTSVLHEFSDNQLEEMGVARCDIPKHAAHLLQQD